MPERKEDVWWGLGPVWYPQYPGGLLWIGKTTLGIGAFEYNEAPGRGG